MSQKIFLSALIVAALGVATEIRLVTRQRDRLTAEKHRLAQLENRVETARAQRDETLAAQQAAVEQLSSLQKSADEKEARRAPVKAWWRRIEQLQQRLDEMPGEKIPELKLLTMKDWIEAVLFTETASDEQIHKLFAALRAKARARFAAQLPEALRRFTEASGGELPASVLDLAPFLTPPGNATMLAGYTLARTGKIGARDETLLTSTGAEIDAKIALDSAGWNRSTNDTSKASEILDGFDTLGAGSIADRFAEFDFPSWGAAMETVAAQLEAAGVSAPGDEEFLYRLKAAVKKFTAAQGIPPTNVAQLLVLLPEASRLAEFAHHFRSRLEFVMDHGGKPAADPNQLRRYLERPMDVEGLLRAFKLTIEGDKVTMSFSLI